MRFFNVIFYSRKITDMPKKSVKLIQEKPEIIQTGPITVDKSGGIIVKINAKPGAKINNITGIYIYIVSWIY